MSGKRLGSSGQHEENATQDPQPIVPLWKLTWTFLSYPLPAVYLVYLFECLLRHPCRVPYSCRYHWTAT